MNIDEIMYIVDGIDPLHIFNIKGWGGLGYKPRHYDINGYGYLENIDHQIKQLERLGGHKKELSELFKIKYGTLKRIKGEGIDKEGNIKPPLKESTLNQKNDEELNNIFIENLEMLEVKHYDKNGNIIELPENLKRDFEEENKVIKNILFDRQIKGIENIEKSINKENKNIELKKEKLNEEQENINEVRETLEDNILDGKITYDEAVKILQSYKSFDADIFKKRINELIDKKQKTINELISAKGKSKFDINDIYDLELEKLKELKKSMSSGAKKVIKYGEAPFIEYQKEYEENKKMIKENIEQNDIEMKIKEDANIKKEYEKIDNYNPIPKYDFNDDYVKSKEHFDGNEDFEKLQDNYEMLMSLIKSIDEELFNKFIISYDKGFEPKIIENLNTKDLFDNKGEGKNAYIDGLVKIQYMNSNGNIEDIWIGIEYKFYGGDKSHKYINNPEYIYQDIINNNEEDFEIYNKYTIDNLITIDKEIFVLEYKFKKNKINKDEYEQKISIHKKNRDDLLSSMNNKDDYLNGFLNMCELSTINVKASKFSIKENELTIKPNSRGRDKEYEYLKKIYKNFKERPVINQNGLIEKIVDRKGNEINEYSKKGFKNAKNYTIIGLQDFVVGMNMSKAVKDGILNNNDPLMSFKLNKSAYDNYLGDHIGLYSWLFKPFKIQSNKKKLFKK